MTHPKQVIRQDAQEDMRLHPVLQVMEDRTLRQRCLDRPERTLRTGQRHVHQPRLSGRQIRAIGPQQITPIEQLGLGLLVGVGLMTPAVACRS